MAIEPMEGKKRVMTESPLNAETPREYLRSWITPNAAFFNRNQNAIMETPVDLADWRLTIGGEVEQELRFHFAEILRMPKATVANTLECSGNSRSLFKKKARGNPWTVGGVGNAVWGGVWLKEVLLRARPIATAKYVSFEGFDKPVGRAGIRFVRSIPIAKAMESTLLAYEMNGEPLPLKHGYPMRGLALGWTGANCVKWLSRITLLTQPYEGFFMDNVYRIFQKGQDSKEGEVVARMGLKSFITQPLPDEKLSAGPVAILGVAYAGENRVERVEVSTDGGNSWEDAAFIGPNEAYAWRQWQYIWQAAPKGTHKLMVRATDAAGGRQPRSGAWNVLGYGNNGIEEHATTVQIV